MTLNPDPAPEPATLPISPERAAYIRSTTLRVAAAIVDQLLADLAAAPSTASSSLQDRAMLRMLTPWLPKLRAVLLSKLSEADPVAVERGLGAVAWSIEQLLEQAPGDPLPRLGLTWEATPLGPRMVLVPLDG